MGRAGISGSSSRVLPLMSFMARNGRPSARVPTWCTAGMPGCCNWPVIRASLRKRSGRYRIGRVAFGQQLDGDIAIEGGVAGAVDDAHAAVADLVEEFVARRAEAGDGRLGGNVPGKSRGVDQVFGHGSSFPRSSAAGAKATAQYTCKPLGFPPQRRIATSTDASTSRSVSSSNRNLRRTALRLLSARDDIDAVVATCAPRG